MTKTFQSEHLMQGDYDEQTRTLVVTFVNGAMHAYYDIPQHVADVLFAAGSPGSYFHSKIKGRYQESQITAGVTKSGRRSRRRF